MRIYRDLAEALLHATTDELFNVFMLNDETAERTKIALRKYDDQQRRENEEID